MREIKLIVIMLVGLGALYPLQRSIDRSTPAEVGDETLFITSGKTIKRMSAGLEALAADLYWIRTIQYFGKKLIDSGKPLSSAATKDIQMDLLAPFLNIVVTLDPQHLPAYRFGAMFLPERDMPAAISLVEKGIRENPNAWRLYQDLGYIYWQAGNTSTGQQQVDNYAKSAEWYEKGGNAEGAPFWMHDLAGLMQIKGGSREAARAVYSAYLSSDDQNVRAQAIDRLKQLQSLDELDAINALIASYKQHTGACPTDLRQFASRFRAMNFALNEDSVPIDPDGFPYSYDPAKCKAELDFMSSVSR
jgi:tetratricopeptide (TPR) repeat protein